MGRRKERRIAAISAAGRRVKLDLFAEPSGDFRGSTSQEEVGEDGDSKTRAGLPSSPSLSSGQQPQNPLLLLEQYSDEELDESSNEGLHHNAAEDSHADMDHEAKISVQEETEDIENNQLKGTASEKVEQFLIENGSVTQGPFQKPTERSTIQNDSGDLQGQPNKVEDTTYQDAPDGQVGDISSGWKMVLHEESNQYYYWNVATGETSWEVLDVLAPETVIASVEKSVQDAEQELAAEGHAYKSNMPLNMEKDDVSTSTLNLDSQANCQSIDSANHGSNEGLGGDSIEDEEGNIDAKKINRTSLLCRPSEEIKSGTDLSLQLVKHCESLLERLNSVKSLNGNLEGPDFRVKCALEIEIRLADIMALASHGSSLLPFWVHSEDQLKRLEVAINSAIQCHSFASTSRLEAMPESCEGTGGDILIDSSDTKALVPVESHTEHNTQKSNVDADNDLVTTTQNVPPSWYSSTNLVNDVEKRVEINGVEKENRSTPGHVLHAVEDVDMDVDMEVEDTPSVESLHLDASGAQCDASTELSILHNIAADQESAVSGQQVVSVPLVEEGIPPPPPDNEPFLPPPPEEPFPPPPPDEPPGISYPTSSHLESVQPYNYSEQYPLSYPGSNVEYYGPTNLEVSGIAGYTHPEGGGVAVSHLPHYYEAVSNVYATAPLVINPVEPTAYYGMQNETLYPVAVATGAAALSLGTQMEPIQNLDSGASGSLVSNVEAGPSLLMKHELQVFGSGHGIIKGALDVRDAQPSIGAPPSSSVTTGISVTSTSDTTTGISAASATPNVQPKAARVKKRTVATVSTLRSNKKVSTLVDKWKAAKEELQEEEEEEEPEDAYEKLEKKRQREIEEWRAHQIASGEAKDNANFQPLCGDWRERVKRKRAEKMKETGQGTSDSTDGRQQPDLVELAKQPDLVELAKGLPSGWQAYWDDSSKQVYYGNVWTSETTWIRPAD